MYKVECPYCRRPNNFKWEGEEEFNMTCEHCEHEFIVEVELEPFFYSHRTEIVKQMLGGELMTPDPEYVKNYSNRPVIKQDYSDTINSDRYKYWGE